MNHCYLHALPHRSKKIVVYDTTLRDGVQREKISLSVEDKLQIAREIDRLGIPFIEGGWPGANPKDAEFFHRLKKEPLTQAQAVAFCSTRRPGKTAIGDPILESVLAAETAWVTVFGKSWDFHVKEGLKTTLEENLAMIHDTIEFFRERGHRVIYDAEHWFDAYTHNPTYALKTLEAAITAGAEWFVFCDTNGGSLPHKIAEIVREVLQIVKESPELKSQIQFPNYAFGIHAHNDSETAVANTLAAVQEGVCMVQGTINGYGERCGNANLCSVIPNLQLKLNYSCIPDQQLSHLTSASRFVSAVTNMSADNYAPFVGFSAFAHKAGVHVNAVERNPRTYEHIQPELVGNGRRIVISEQSGISNVIARTRSLGLSLNKEDSIGRQILQRLKDLENEGYQYEVAEASFNLLILELLDKRQLPFTLKSFRVDCNLIQREHMQTEKSRALVHVSVCGQEITQTSEADGPVAALYKALQGILVKFYLIIDQFQVTDYKVRILNECAGVTAKTRVLIEFTDGQQFWNTIGVSTNILAASCQALVEGLEYGLLLYNRGKLETLGMIPAAVTTGAVV